MTVLHAEEFTLRGDACDGGLALSFKRYTPPLIKRNHHNSIALLLAHCVSTHKETWEPTLSHLFDLQLAAQRDDFNDSSVWISEAWVVDAPNHGQAAVLNATALLAMPEGISGYCWARAVGKLLTSGLILAKQIIGIGHSAGSAIMILSTSTYPLDALPYSSMILVEPGMMTREIFAEAFKEPVLLKEVMDATKTRKDIWPSRTAALEWFKKREPWRRWDPAVLQLLTQYALRDLPTKTYPDRKNGVTLTYAFDSLDRLSELCSTIPVHTIFGSRHDLIAKETHEGIVDPKQGRKMASISTVPDSGHLVAQENPAGLALALWRILNQPQQPNRSRL
ncbi:hypothetical protein A0H81_00120 [Grifola frondosa]|uniref:AB hydrolase-1 domain-containing protein n=1 Tax=Grifola frondosa TaxID=5627 RepID=A0A1C7MSM5_GRIFR|nr:hypothetical protein A0H81_00120 [Grifola frondosa]